MQIAFYRPHNRLSHRLIPHFHQLRLYYGKSRIHSSRRNQNLRNKYLVILKFRANQHHAVNQAVIQDFFCIHPLFQRLYHQILYNPGFPLLQEFRNFRCCYHTSHSSWLLWILSFPGLNAVPPSHHTFSRYTPFLLFTISHAPNKNW